MKRIFLPSPLPRHEDRGELRLDGADFHHVAKVLRLGVDARLELIDDDGWIAEGAITRVTRRELWLDLSPARQLPPPPSPHLTLIYGIARGGRTELVLQKATELGVDHLMPVISTRSVARPDDPSHKRTRWLEVLRQAARQSERTRLPTLAPPRPLGETLDSLRDRFIGSADEDEATPPQTRSLALIATLGAPPFSHQTAAIRRATSITMLVGPEGGLTTEEVEHAQDRGFRPVSLGPTVLRSETAALTLITLAAFSAGRLDLATPVEPQP